MKGMFSVLSWFMEPSRVGAFKDWSLAKVGQRRSRN
jgi:hypothetical protein